MSKKSHHGIAILAKKTNKALELFAKQLKSNEFRKRTEKEILTELMELRVKMPKRATPENATQDQWIYKSDSGYEVVIHTGMIQNQFIDHGSSWIIIRDENKNAIFIREFYRRNPVNLIEKLLAYAKFAYAIARYKKPGMQLIHISELEMKWEKKNGEHEDFELTMYLDMIEKREASIVRKTEREKQRYLSITTGKVRREKEFRSVWV